MTSSPTRLRSGPALPANDLKQLVALAKARPGEINYASAGIGNMNHLAAELFNMTTGVKTINDVMGLDHTAILEDCEALMARADAGIATCS